MKPRTAAKRRADAIRSRKWRLANPDRARELRAEYRARNPLTPEQRAHKAEVNRAWRVRNAAKLKREQKRRWDARRDDLNAKRRAKYAADPAHHTKRRAAWKAAHPGHCRVFYHRHREKFTGNGPWSARSKRLKRAWRTFTKTCAAGRAVTQEQSQ